jgi:hypothetical protein
MFRRIGFSLRAIWLLAAGLSCAMASRLALLLGLMAAPAAAQQVPVAVELVLALDSSASVDGQEFALQIEGLALAFRDMEVQRAVEDLRPLGAAVAVVQWGAPGETRMVLPFTHLVNARDSKAFGFRIGLVRRWTWASATSIATAITDSAALIETNGFDGYRKVIDVSGDGEDNAGEDLEAARQSADALGIIVNGLPIMADVSTLDRYYRDRVIIGVDCFIEPARDFDDYVRAIREKLLRELRPLAS